MVLKWLIRSIPERDHYQRGLIAAEEAFNAQFGADRGNAAVDKERVRL